MLNKIISNKSLKAVGQVTFVEANSVEDDIHLYQRNEDGERIHFETFYGIRQQVRLDASICIFFNLSELPKLSTLAQFFHFLSFFKIFQKGKEAI